MLLFIHSHTDRYGDSNSKSCFRPPIHFIYRLRILKMAVSFRLRIFPLYLLSHLLNHLFTIRLISFLSSKTFLLTST